jgi:hypothetical protein
MIILLFQIVTRVLMHVDFSIWNRRKSVHFDFSLLNSSNSGFVDLSVLCNNKSTQP